MHDLPLLQLAFLESRRWVWDTECITRFEIWNVIFRHNVKIRKVNIYYRMLSIYVLIYLLGVANLVALHRFRSGRWVNASIVGNIGHRAT